MWPAISLDFDKRDGCTDEFHCRIELRCMHLSDLNVLTQLIALYLFTQIFLLNFSTIWIVLLHCFYYSLFSTTLMFQIRCTPPSIQSFPLLFVLIFTLLFYM